MTEGTIVKGIGGFYYVASEGGVVECRARGRLRRQGVVPMVGDRVRMTVQPGSLKDGAVEEVLERKNFLVRPPVANIDCIVIVVAAASPAPDFFMIDKLTVAAESRGIEVVLAVNKTDLLLPDAVFDVYGATGYTLLSVCAATGEGIDALRARIAGKTAAFAGNSGVGKSSILNYFGLHLQTGSVSRIERGRHTTRHVELFETADGGFVMDTPGFSLLELQGIEADGLKAYFPEFAPFEGLCRFSGCSHAGVPPRDCAVAAAAADGRISAVRYGSYTQLFDLLKEVKKWEKS